MDPCPFVRLLVGNLAVKIPVSAKPARSAVHPSLSPCYCKVRLRNSAYQTSVVPLIPPENNYPDGQPQTLAATFHLSKSDVDKFAVKSFFSGKTYVKIAIYTGRRGTTCGINSGKLLGKVSICLELTGAETKPVIFQNGWISIGKGPKGSSAQLFLTVKAEPDPRYVFQFDGEPECSPQVFQIQGNLRQPVFTCKFSLRNTNDWSVRSRSIQSESSCTRSWLSSLGSERERHSKERKGWSIAVHDLSGAPVAIASMVTPFVASPNTDRVSRSNPGAWLILRSGIDGTLKPWGRLEAWRERGGGDNIGYRFELQLPDISNSSILLAESTFSARRGGKFSIDLSRCSTPAGPSPACSPHGSGDYGYGLWPFCAYRGFVMSSTVDGGGKCSRPIVEVGVQHVGCREDAAAYVALAAAVDLSVDACKFFSQKLRKELCQRLDL